MPNKVLVLDRILGGLESDISDHFSEVDFILLPHKPGRFKSLIWLLLNFSYARSFRILSCGGKWQVLWCLLLLRECIIFFPGVPASWYGVIRMLNKVNTGITLMTCDILTAQRLSTSYYTNYRVVDRFPSESIQREVDVLLVGRNDANKRFKEYGIRLIKKMPSINIAHAGEPKISECNINAFGQLSSVRLNELYQRSKVVCLPSVYESSPRVVQEALKNGCIVVTSHVGNLQVMSLHKPLKNLEDIVDYTLTILSLSEAERLVIYYEQIRRFNKFTVDMPSLS